ncbi:MAG TPA: hypothetical protein VGE07_27170, partial [Herpetosiphonaceae bacterium]
EGGTPVRLNRTLPANADIVDFSISPNSAQVLFRGDYVADQQFDLLRVPITGGTPITINDTLVAGGSVLDYAFLPNSSRAVYRADQDANDVIELYGADLSGNGVKLSGTLAGGGDVSGFAITRDSSRVVYRADQDTDEVAELYSVQPAGTGRRKVSATLAANGDAADFALDSRSIRAVYLADQNTDGKDELFSAQIAAATPGPVTISGSLGNSRDVTDFAIAPNGSRVVFRADRSSEDVFELYSVSITGTNPIKINATFANTATGDIVAGGYQIAPNNSRVIYLADAAIEGKDELWTAQLGGGGTARVSPSNMTANGDVVEFAIAPDSGRVVYLADQINDEKFELFSARLDGTQRAQLNFTDFTGDVLDFKISNNGQYVVFRQSYFVTGQISLLSAPITGGAPIRTLNGTLNGRGNVAAADGSPRPFSIASDDEHVVYLADQIDDEQFELFTVAPDFLTYLPIIAKGQ